MEKQEFVEFVKEATREVFAKQGGLRRCLLALDSEGRFCPVEFAGLEGVELDREEEGAMFQYAIARLRAEYQMVAHAAEAWTVMLQKRESFPDEPIRKHPDRQEVLIISFCGQDPEDTAIAVCPILREGDEPELGDWMEEPIKSLQGRLFPEPEPPPEWN